MRNDRKKSTWARAGVMTVMTLVLILICGSEALAGMNLETDAAVSGIAVALNNYYARTVEPESALAESVRMVAGDTIVLDSAEAQKTTHAVQKLVEEVTPTEEKIVKEGEGGLTWGTVKGTASLRLRDRPSADARTLTLLAKGEHYIVTGQEGQFLKIQVDDDLEGYVFKDYIDTSISYDDELAREKAKLAAQAEAAKKEAAEAMKKLEEVKKAGGKTAEKGSEETAAATTEAASEVTEAASAKAETAEETTRPTETVKTQETAEELNWDDDPDEDQGEGMWEVEAPDFDEEMGDDEDEQDWDEDEEPSETVGNRGSAGPGGVTDATRTAMVAYAKQFLGNPYVYGGTSLTNGCDCSGFTMSIYAYFGMSIGRSSRDQAANGKRIDPSDAQPGDLFFYDSSGTINHVAMYIGGGQVIHSSSSATGIRISNAYYRTPCKVCTYF